LPSIFRLYVSSSNKVKFWWWLGEFFKGREWVFFLSFFCFHLNFIFRALSWWGLSTAFSNQLVDVGLEEYNRKKEAVKKKRETKK